MSHDVLTMFYNDTHEKISKGDEIILDGEHLGVIEEILLPKTHRARLFSAYHTGGLLISGPYLGCVVELFGSTASITKNTAQLGS